MTRYDIILSEKMSEYWWGEICNNDELKKYIEDSMKESAWQTWKCFAFNQRENFEKWWNENPPSMLRKF